jgi:predicted metal-dependent HD superfamily phosphohydrolase
MTSLDLETSFKNVIKSSFQAETVAIDEILTQWWHRITSAYGEPQRHYHTMDHITSMWELYDSTINDAHNDSNIVRLAIIFHEYALRSVSSGRT